MHPLPPDLFLNPVAHALETEHRHLALSTGNARRYPADIAPFAAVLSPGPLALKDLATLVTPSESVWICAPVPPTFPAFEVLQTLPCLQMAFPPNITLSPSTGPEILQLSAADAPDMVALTTLAFPGFFRARTYLMGAYFGIRHHGQLIAMGGERLRLPGYPEISGICTHPAHRGHGHAASLIAHLVRKHRLASQNSWLHVSASNHKAIALYNRLGFTTSRTITLHHLRRI